MCHGPAGECQQKDSVVGSMTNSFKKTISNFVYRNLYFIETFLISIDEISNIGELVDK